MANELVIRSRVEFDELWTAGLEVARVRVREVVDGRPVTRTRGVTDAPIAAQVWWRFAQQLAYGPVDLLIDESTARTAPPAPMALGGPAAPVSAPRTPRAVSAKATAVDRIRSHVIDSAASEATLDSTLLAQGFGCIALSVTFTDLVQGLLPLTTWAGLVAEAQALSHDQTREAMRAFRRLDGGAPELAYVGWFLHLLAVCGPRSDANRPVRITYGPGSRSVTYVRRLLEGVRPADTSRAIGRVSLNRSVKATVDRSQRTVKADATRSLFRVRCDAIRWAVIDSGIDARHTWFQRLDDAGEPLGTSPFHHDVDGDANYTRVLATYAFYRQREPLAHQRADQPADLPGNVPVAMDLGDDLYEPPGNGHGTHVAGIIGGVGGICPDIELYDFRVLDENGKGDEFSVVAALRHILDLTQRESHADPTGRTRDLPIHGVNLSLALDADVTSDACGWSLVCRVCDELVRAGVVVVVSAGNTGFDNRGGGLMSTGHDYRTLSITDPGNTERVITVGSTDADRPREYGISYFSARGPTADGRAKPDLVAPGNAITSSYGFRRKRDGVIVEDETDAEATLDGTSMAAAHVSGCAALILARHRELIGKPEELKQVLMASATDLRRDRTFQGAGLVDALRAVQSI